MRAMQPEPLKEANEATRPSKEEEMAIRTSQRGTMRAMQPEPLKEGENEAIRTPALHTKA